MRVAVVGATGAVGREILKALEARIRAQAMRLAERKAEAERLKEILENLTLTIPVRAGETKIYGSVTAKDNTLES
ncbi:hypothetical protein MHTCC0001_36450 [Flavobacteriaceae bacterium MHTCC 0001]